MIAKLWNRRRRSSTELMMTPMIDVVFLLLVFFLATASFELAEQLLPTPVSQGAESPVGANAPTALPTAAVNDCVIRMRWIEDGGAIVYELNGEAMADRESLLHRVQPILAAAADIPMIVDPDETIPLATVVSLYDRLRQLGGTQVYFSAK